MQILGPALDLVFQNLQCVFGKQAQGVVSSPIALSCPFILRVGEGSQALPRAARGGVGQGHLVMVPCAAGKSASWASKEMQKPGCDLLSLQEVPPWRPSYGAAASSLWASVSFQVHKTGFL